jgi:hypothetical protein
MNLRNWLIVFLCVTSAGIGLMVAKSHHEELPATSGGVIRPA